MPSVDSEPFQPNRGNTGTIVFSSSCRLCFIDQRAIRLVGRLDPGFPAAPHTTPLPSCLMQVMQDIAAARHPHDSAGCSPLPQVYRFIGSPSDPIRVQGFRVQRQAVQDGWIVLILSEGVPGNSAVTV
jgi:hypothetical protein